jgi:hypothetical protein
MGALAFAVAAALTLTPVLTGGSLCGDKAFAHPGNGNGGGNGNGNGGGNGNGKAMVMATATGMRQSDPALELARVSGRLAPA